MLSDAQMVARVVEASRAPAFLTKIFSDWVMSNQKEATVLIVEKLERSIEKAKDSGLAKDQKPFLETMYKEALAVLKDDQDAMLQMLPPWNLYKKLEEGMTEALGHADGSPYAPEVDRMDIEYSNTRVKLDFRLTWGQSDPDNLDTMANAPKPEELLRRGLGLTCSARLGGTDPSADYAYFWAVTCEVNLDLQTILPRPFFSGLMKALEQERLSA